MVGVKQFIYFFTQEVRLLVKHFLRNDYDQLLCGRHIGTRFTEKWGNLLKLHLRLTLFIYFRVKQRSTTTLTINYRSTYGEQLLKTSHGPVGHICSVGPGITDLQFRRGDLDMWVCSLSGSLRSPREYGSVFLNGISFLIIFWYRDEGKVVPVLSLTVLWTLVWGHEQTDS